MAFNSASRIFSRLACVLPCGFSAGVNPFGLAGFRVLHRDPADGGELPVEGIGNTERYEVVLSARLTQRLVKTLIPEVGNEEGDGPLFHGGQEVFQCRIDVGAFALRFHFDDFPDDAQDVGAAFFGRDEAFDAVAEQHGAHFVVVSHGAECQHRAELRDEVALGLLARSGCIGSAHIKQQEDGKFTLFLEHLDVRVTHARSDVPVDGSNFIAVLVLAVFGERHATSLERAVVFPRENPVAQSAGFQFNPPYPLNQFGCVHASRHLHVVHDLGDDLLGADVFSLRLKRQANAMAQHV